MVRNSNINNLDDLNNFDNNNNINNNNDSGNSEEIEDHNNIAFKRMKITGEVDEDINTSQHSYTIMDNDNLNSSPMNRNDESLNEFNSSSNQIDTFSSSNYRPLDQINNKAISNTRDDMYQAAPCVPPRNTSLSNNEDSNDSDEDPSPPPYDSIFSTNDSSNYTSNYSSSYSRNHIPGTTGLSNLGNTCFMNSGLQCISHTVLLRDYLLKGYWKKELNLTSIHGMKGKMVKAYVKVLENLWGKNDGPYRPTEFKSVISKHTPSFEGYHQHDCQEFIASLLDGLHEDINRVPVKKFEEYPDMNEMEDEEAARTSWDLHIRRENSFIVDLFYGQYRSINICQECNTVRKNFEPFIYLTLPIPENQEIEIPIQVLLNGKLIDDVRVSVFKSDSIATLKNKISEKLIGNKSISDIEINKDNMEIFQVRSRSYNSSISSYLSNVELVENIQSLEHNYYTLYAYIVSNKYSLDTIKGFLPLPMEDRKCNNKPIYLNVPVYHKVENADKYAEDDNGFPFLINLPNLNQFKDEEENIDRRLLGWIVYREIVKYYKNFTDHKIATMDPSDELDPEVFELLKRIREEEEKLNKNIANSMKKNSKSDSHSSDTNDNENEEIFNNDDEVDSQQGNASSNNDASLSDIQINNSLDDSIQKNMETEEIKPANEDEDTLLENTYQSMQVKRFNAAANADDADINKKSFDNETEIKDEKKEDDVDTLYPINDGWKIMPKLFDVQLIYTEKIDSNFYSYGYSYSCPRVALYNAKDNSSKESDPYESRPSYRSTTENRSAKVKMNPREFIIVVSWKPAVLEFLFGKEKFKVFTPKESNQSVNKPEAQPISLEECIQEFIKEEILTDENKWFCPHCKDDREAYKKMDIWRAPEILIVHIKRFIQDRQYYSSRKNNVLVTFPIKGLDLTDIIKGPKKDEKYIYNLYAISNHSGSTGGGHYTAYVKVDDKWYDCNDSFVSEVSESSIVSSSAYLLFYERCHEPGNEFKLPDLEGKPDIIDEEEQREQMLLQQRRMQMQVGVPMAMSNESGMDRTYTTITSDYTMTSRLTYHKPENFADFNNAGNMYTSTSTDSNALIPINKDSNDIEETSNFNTSNINNNNNNNNNNISTKDEILYDTKEKSHEDSEDLMTNDNDTVVEEKENNMEN